METNVGDININNEGEEESSFFSTILSNNQEQEVSLPLSTPALAVSMMESQMAEMKQETDNVTTLLNVGSIAATVKSKKRAASLKSNKMIIITKTDNITTDEEGLIENKDLILESIIDKEIFPEDRCANCLHPFEPENVGETKLISDLNLSVKEALYSIFRIPNDINSETTESHHQILFCSSCNQSLSVLYTAFMGFIELTKENSILTMKLRQLDEEIIKVRQRLKRKQKSKNILERNIKSESVFLDDEEEEEMDFITGDMDEDFQISSPSELANIGLESSSSSSEEDTYIPSKIKKLSRTRKKTRKTTSNDAEDYDTGSTNIKVKIFKQSKVLEQFTYTCSVCDANFLKPRELRIHLRDFHKKDLLSNANNNSSSITTNNELILPENHYNCQICFQNFDNQDLFVEHQLLQHAENSQEMKQEDSHSCQQCSMIFGDVASLKIHEKTHNVKTPYKCTKCKLSFSRADVLRVHFNEHDDDKLLKVKDDEDQEENKHKNTPQKRVTVKSKKTKKSIITNCEFCGKDFVRLDQLKQHLRVHTKEKPHTCNTCDKKFADIRGLSYHKLIHIDARKYCCTVCGRTFKRLHHLTDHETYVHSKNVERPFACLSCPKSFKHKKHLNTHLITHGGSKLHSCNICLKAFTRKDNLLQHVRKVHKEEIHQKQEQEGSALQPGETITLTLPIPITLSTENRVTTSPTALVTEEIQLQMIESANLDQVVYINL